MYYRVGFHVDTQTVFTFPDGVVERRTRRGGVLHSVPAVVSRAFLGGHVAAKTELKMARPPFFMGCWVDDVALPPHTHPP